MSYFIAMLKEYFKLLRIPHYIKNVIIFVPILFRIQFTNIPLLINAGLGFICFSLLSSIVYILNDLQDIDKDRLHNIKCRRPLASGKISVSHAIVAMIILAILLIILLVGLKIPGNYPHNLHSFGLLFLYLLLNIGYSCGLKNIPIVDITIIASGYVIRVLFGAVLIGSEVSVWLYLVITMGAYYLGLGKRRNELTNNGNNTREVMRFYSHNFLDKNMYVCQALCIMFYTLWSIDPTTVEYYHSLSFVYTIPLVFLILFKYSLNIESNTEGDPTSILLKDKFLLLLIFIYIICVFYIIYINIYAP